MNKWEAKNREKKISASHIKTKDTEDLKQARDFINSLLEVRKLDKLYNTYITGTQKAVDYNKEDKVYFDFRFGGTLTGRLSCGAQVGHNKGDKKGVSLHTLPREKNKKYNIRNIFCAPKGYAFATHDYSTMELRVLAYLCNEVNMKKAFLSGEDLHTYTATLIFGKSKDKITKDERQIAKSISFLIVYGGTFYKLADDTGLSLNKAEWVVKEFKKVYPRIADYILECEEFIRKNGYITSIFGRTRHLGNIKSYSNKIVAAAIRQGLNFTVQSPASDILMCAMLGIDEEYKKLKTARIVGSVHDSTENVFEFEEIKQALEIGYDQMVNYPYLQKHFGIKFDIPLQIESEIGYRFGEGEEVHYKDGLVTNMNSIYEYLIKNKKVT